MVTDTTSHNHTFSKKFGQGTSTALLEEDLFLPAGQPVLIDDDEEDGFDDDDEFEDEDDLDDDDFEDDLEDEDDDFDDYEDDDEDFDEYDDEDDDYY